MKILQLSARFPYPLTDGGAIGIYNITRSLAESGNDVTLVSFPLGNASQMAEGIAKISKFANVRLVSRPLPSRTRVLLKTIFAGAYPIERRMMPEMFQLLREILDSQHFDVVHLDHSHVGKYGVWIKEKYNIPVVLRQHNYETLIYQRFSKSARNPLSRLIARVHAARLKIEETSILMGVDAIAAITAEDVQLMRLVAPSAHYSVIPAGVDTHYYQPERVNEQVACSLLLLGGMNWEPNHDALLYFVSRIFPAILDKEPGTVLNVVGEGTESLKLPKMLQSSVRLFGTVKDIRPVIRQSAVMVVPLRIGGGMRVKLLDFFAMEKAVVATRVAAEGNRGRDGEEVILRDEPLEFAEAVVDLLRNEKRREALGKSARAMVERHYSWQAVADALIQLYNSVARESPPKRVVIEEHYKA